MLATTTPRRSFISGLKLNPVIVKPGEKQSQSEDKLLKKNGRGEWIRTTDLLVPNQAL